jgi:hypothetical protein
LKNISKRHITSFGWFHNSVFTHCPPVFHHYLKGLSPQKSITEPEKRLLPNPHWSQIKQKPFIADCTVGGSEK